MSCVDHLDGIDEIRPGNYIFFDAYQATLGSCGFEDTALTVLTAVIHKDTSRRKLVVDAGAIAAVKGPRPRRARSGMRIRPRTRCRRQRNRHACHVAVAGTRRDRGGRQLAFDSIKVGDRLRILANHSCLTAAQHSHYHVFENGEIVDKWEIHRGW